MDMSGKRTMADLYRIANHDPLVHAVLQMFEQGQFATFEQGLIALCCLLAEDKQRLMDKLVLKFQESPPPVIVTREKS